ISGGAVDDVLRQADALRPMSLGKDGPFHRLRHAEALLRLLLARFDASGRKRHDRSRMVGRWQTAPLQQRSGRIFHEWMFSIRQGNLHELSRSALESYGRQ